MELERGVVGALASIPALAQAAADRDILTSCGRLVSAARAAGVPVVHAIASWRSDRAGTPLNTPLVRALSRNPAQILEGTEAVELVPELGDCSGDRTSTRRHGLTPFTGTDLHEQLRSVGATTVVACGVSLNVGVLGLCLSAADLGYEVVLATDAVVGVPVAYGDDVIRHTLSTVASCGTVAEITAPWIRS